MLSKEVSKFSIEEDKQTVDVTFNNEVEKGNLSFKKVDSVTGRVLDGAKLNIKGISDTNNYINKDFVSSKDGNTIDNLPYGDYEITEIEAPTGYMLSKEVSKFSIEEDKQTIDVTFNNEVKKGILIFKKVDSATGQTLDGATISIKGISETNNHYSSTFVTSSTNSEDDKEGDILEDLPYGEYEIEEIKSPEGYELNPNKITATITENGENVVAEIQDNKIAPIEEIQEEKPVKFIPKTKDNANLIELSLLVLASLVVLGMNNFSAKKSKVK